MAFFPPLQYAVWFHNVLCPLVVKTLFPSFFSTLSELDSINQNLWITEAWAYFQSDSLCPWFLVFLLFGSSRSLFVNKTRFNLRVCLHPHLRTFWLEVTLELSALSLVFVEVLRCRFDIRTLSGFWSGNVFWGMVFRTAFRILLRWRCCVNWNNSSS